MFILADGAPQGDGSPWLMIVRFWPVIAFVAIMYFLLIAPQRKKEKHRRAMLQSLEKKDRIVTIGGIHGVVKSISENEVTVLVDEKNNLTLKLNRSAVYSIVSREETGELPRQER